MSRPDGCTCGMSNVPNDGSHLPGCPVVPIRAPILPPPMPAPRRLLDSLALIGLVEHIEHLHRELGDLGPKTECPFVRALREHRTSP